MKANVILDNVNIQNDDLYDLDIKGCASDDERDQLFPFMEIMGTANLYLKGENTITIPVLDQGPSKENTSAIFELYGQLTIREDAGTPDSSLKVNNARYLIHGGGSDEYYSVGGSFTMESGTLTAWGADINYLEQWHMLGGAVTCYNALLVNYGDYQFLGGDITSNWISSPGTAKMGTARLFVITPYRKPLEDRNGYSLQKLTVSGLPASQKVIAVNGYPSSTLETSETGTLEAYLRKGSNVIEIDGKSYLYKWNEETSELKQQSDAELCTVQFVLDGSESPYCTVKVEKNTAFGKLFNDNQYTYTYQTKDGTEFNEETVITSDMTVTMKSYVREYNVTIDGVTEKMSTLPAGKMYLNPPESDYGSSKYYYAYGSCYYGGSRVTRDMTLESLDVVTDHGTDYVKISDKKELIRFFKMAAVDDHINARLEADIDMNGERLTIYIGDYAGIFDGNGYSIKNMKGEQNATGAICRTLKGTIRNLCIEDIWLPGSEDEYFKYNSRGSAGVICGINRGLIENCKVAGSKITLNIADSGIYEGGYDPVGTVAGVNLGEIRNCLAVENEFDMSIFENLSKKPDESKILFPIAGNYGTITNCYYDAPENVETEDTELRAGIGRTAEIFKSGEICYLLNDKISDGTQVWYQKLSEETGDDYPTLVKEEGNTVYDGYVNCTKAYTNEKDSKETHTFTYTAKDDTLTATCKWAEDHQANAVLKVASAVYDKKEHGADVDYEDAWTALGIEPADIQYLRDGKPTTDITSVGTITAVLAQGDVKAEKEYTIAKAAQPDNVPEASASVPFTQKKVTQDMLKLENGWEISEDSIGMDIPEKESVTIDVVYTGEDAQSYENIMAKVQVQRAACGHDLVKVDAVAATESKEGNKEYYLCKDCGKLFGDAQGTKEITKESTVLPKVEKPQPTVKPTVVPATSVPGTSIPASGAPSATPGTTTPASGAPTTTPGTTTPATGAPTTTPGTTTPTPDIPAPAPGTPTPAPGAPTPVPDMPTPAPGAPTPIPTAAPQETAQSSAKQSSVPKTEKKDSKLTDESGATYKVTGTTDKKPTVTYISTKKTGKASITIPSSIEVNGVKYQVTSIADNAFRKNKKLKKITIGKEIVSIGKRAFEGCKNLKEIVIETEKLKAKTVGKKAFAKTSSEVVVNVPKKKAKEYKKLLRKRGLSKNAVFKTK